MHPVDHHFLPQAFWFFNVKDRTPTSSQSVKKIVANVLLDSKIKNSGLEGASFFSSLNLVSRMVSLFKDPLRLQIFEKLDACKNWSSKLRETELSKLNDVTKEITKKGRALPIGDSILIPGSWYYLSSGHAMLYLLEKEERNLYTFYIINTGSGIEYHLKLDESKERKYLLACCYKKIPEEDLFYGKNGEDFFKNLLSIVWKQFHYPFDPAVIYQGIFGRLAPYRDDTALVQNTTLFIIGQRGVTCAVRVIKAFIRLAYFLNGASIEAYKMYTLHFRAFVASQYLTYMENNWSEESLCLLDDITRIFAHKIKKEIKKRPSDQISNEFHLLIKKLKSQQISFERNRHFSPSAINHREDCVAQIWVPFEKGERELNSEELLASKELERIVKGYPYRKIFVKSSQLYHLEVLPYGLVFILDKQRVNWEKDPSYFVVEEPLPTETLCVQEKSFLLRDASGNCLLLIPNVTICAKEGFTKLAQVKILDESIYFFKEKYTCYQVLKKEDGVFLKPQTLNATLYLAYYYLYDRRFKKSQQLLKTISPADDFNREHFWILEKIINYGEEEKHYGPEVYACILKGGLLFYQKKRQDNLSFTFSKEMEARLEDICIKYLQTRTHVDRTLRLTQAEERTYDKILATCIFARHLGRLQKNLKKITLDFPICSMQLSFCPDISFHDFSIDPSAEGEIPWSPIYEKDQLKEEPFEFFSVYEAIRLETEDLKTIETYLRMQHVAYPNLETLKVAFLSLVAKKKERNLPPFPYEKQAIQIEKFIQKLRKTLEGVDDPLKEVPKERISFVCQEKEVIPKKVLIPFTFNDLGDFSEESKPLPLFEQFGLKKTPSCNASNGRIDLKSFSKKAVEEKLEESKKKSQWRKESLLQTINHFLEIAESAPLTIEQLRGVAGVVSPVSIEDIEDVAFWGKEHPDSLEIFKGCALVREKAFQEDIWKQLIQYEQNAVQAIACENVLQLYQKIENGPNSDEIGSLYAEFEGILETNLESLSRLLGVSFLHTLILIRRKGAFLRQDELQKAQVSSKKMQFFQGEMRSEAFSIIAAVWAFKTVRFDQKLPVFVTDSSRYQSLVDYFKESQQTLFRQHVFTLPYFSSDSTLSDAKRVLSHLKEGLRQKQLLIIKRDTFEAIKNAFQGREKERLFRKTFNFFKERASLFGDKFNNKSSKENTCAFEKGFKGKGSKKRRVFFRRKKAQFSWSLFTLFAHLFG